MAEQEDPGLAAKWWIALIAGPAIVIALAALWILKPSSQALSPTTQAATGPASMPVAAPIVSAAREVPAPPLDIADESAKLRALIKGGGPNISGRAISGGAWAVKKSGDSSILRGLDIILVAPRVSRAAILRDIDATIVARTKQLAADQGQAYKYRHEGFVDHADFEREEASAKLYEAKVRSSQSKISAAREFRRSVPAAMNTHNVYSLLATFSNLGIPETSNLVGEAFLTDAKTDVDGKYQIQGVPPGLYLVYASTVNDLFAIEWLVPVDLQNNSAHLDLSNDNAERVDNFHE